MSWPMPHKSRRRWAQTLSKSSYPAPKLSLPRLRRFIRSMKFPFQPCQSAFNGRRIVIFSGGATTADEQFFDEARAIRDGGGFGSIIGRNSFQRKKPEALKFLDTVMGIYEGSIR